MAFYHIAVRADTGFDDIHAWFDRRSEAGFMVREYAESGEHVHAYVYSKLKPNSFRVILKREVPALVGNGSYSVAECKDPTKYQQYICKGEFSGSGVDALWQLGPEFTSEKLWDLHETYWEVNRATKVRRVSSVMDYVIDECKEAGVSWEDRRTIAEKYLKELVARSKAINLFAVRSAVNLIQVKLCPNDDALQLLASKVDL